MESNKEALEVSSLVWHDEEENEWMYYVFIIHGDETEELHAWGTADSKAQGAEIVGAEVTSYFNT